MTPAFGKFWQHPGLILSLAGTVGVLGCGSSSSFEYPVALGGSVSVTGGQTGSLSGSTSIGGQTNIFVTATVTDGTGGGSSTGSVARTGGAPATGGRPPTGGVPATGGRSTTGGAFVSGGAPATGGRPGTGGVTATGGRSATGGAIVIGGAPATGGGIATGGTSASGARVKFCHSLSSSGQPLTLTLRVNGVAFSAPTGECAPSSSCTAVPSGTNVPFAFLNGTTTLGTGTIATLDAGSEYLYRATLNSSSQPTIVGGRANGICSGGDGKAGTVAKFCNRLARSDGSDVVVTLNVGGVTVSASTGTCEPMSACVSITSGTNIPISILDGTTIISTGTFPLVTAGSTMLFLAQISTTTSSPTITGAAYAGICSTPAAASVLNLSAAPTDQLWAESLQQEASLKPNSPTGLAYRYKSVTDGLQSFGY